MKLLTSLSLSCIALLVLFLLVETTNAFAPPSSLLAAKRTTFKEASSSSSSAALGPEAAVNNVRPPRGSDRDSNFWITPEKLRFKILKFGKGGKTKVLNLYGLWVLLMSLITFPAWILALSLAQLYGRINKKWDVNRSVFDKFGKIWARAWLKMIGSYPTQSGNVEMLQGKGTIGPCLYVANHGSWLDIAIICTVVQPVFKFIAKGDLKNVPGIGQQLRGGKHILIDREDKRSQLKTFKDGIGWLKRGVPLMAFPEGTRSKTGRLLKFKGGVFAMALKTGVPIVPLSINHAYAVWPAYALLPAQRGRKKLHVHVHDPIESKGRTEAELVDLVRTAFKSKLPETQLPLPKEEE